MDAYTSEIARISSCDTKLLVNGYDVRIKDDEGFEARFDNVRPDELRIYED